MDERRERGRGVHQGATREAPGMRREALSLGCPQGLDELYELNDLNEWNDLSEVNELNALNEFEELNRSLACPLGVLGGRGRTRGVRDDEEGRGE